MVTSTRSSTSTYSRPTPRLALPSPGFLGAAPPRALEPADVDATVVLAAWLLRDRGENDGYVIPLRVEEPVEQQLPDWVAALDSMWSRTNTNPNGSLPQLPAPYQP